MKYRPVACGEGALSLLSKRRMVLSVEVRERTANGILRSEGYVRSFGVQEVKAKGEGEQWKILVIAKVTVDGLTVLCQNFGGRVEGLRGFWYNIGIKKTK